MKINDYRGDLTDVSADKEPLVLWASLATSDECEEPLDHTVGNVEGGPVNGLCTNLMPEMTSNRLDVLTGIELVYTPVTRPSWEVRMSGERQIQLVSQMNSSGSDLRCAIDMVQIQLLHVANCYRNASGRSQIVFCVVVEE